MPSDRIERRARELACSDAGLDDVYRGFDELARQLVPYEVAAWSTLDPASGLMTSCTVTGMPKDPEREALIFAHEFREDEPNNILSMLADRQTTAILSHSTGGDLRLAGRHRAVGEQFGLTDELRGLMWAGGVAWTMVAMYRTDGTFTAGDATRLEELSRWVADAVRIALLRGAAHQPEGLDDPPGVLRIDVDGRVTALTDPAYRWLDVGGHTLVTAAAATAAALRSRPEWEGARTLVSIDRSTMLTLTAASLVADDGHVAVIVDRARKPHLGSMMIEAYGLTPRQREVLGLLLLGRSMTQIARELGISEHTVNDHRKAVYLAFDVASRAELAALLQHEHYLPLRQHLTPSPYGGFLPA